MLLSLWQVEMLLQKAGGITGGGSAFSCGGAVVVAGAGPQEILPHQSVTGFTPTILAMRGCCLVPPSSKDVEKSAGFRCSFEGQCCTGLARSDLANYNPGQRSCSRMKTVPQEVRALPAMMEWVRTQKAGESGVNIITADFVELGDFISTVIKLNYSMDEGEDDTT
ncbi:hypothetical protein DUI87_06600 [Hirundo rustica rustica]|uniref:Uncharacterized protein n=1 Tax=Hirundo rustica rustica TaxID=333673 RepID=A0A3M0KVD8_HIRRU|nr:hypothetical protein DUI87_06600 [Hirundo rustica rustica]